MKSILRTIYSEIPNILIGIVVAFILFAGHAFAGGIPNSFTYHGTLRQSGVPANGTYSMTVNIRNGSGGSVLWTSGALNVTVSSGQFTISLTPSGFDWTLPANTPYIEVSVAGNSLTPQEQLQGVPYAHVSSAATNLSAMGNPEAVISTNVKVTCLSIGSLVCNPLSDSVFLKVGRNNSANDHVVLNANVHIGSVLAPTYSSQLNVSRYDNTYPVVYVRQEHDGGNLMELEGVGTVTNSASSFLALKKNSAYVGAWLLNGRLGAGTLSPAAMLHAFASAGTSGILILASTGTAKHFEVTATSATVNRPFYAFGGAFQPGGGSWTDSSDRRLKERISEIENPLETLLKLRGVHYYWKKDQPNGFQRPTSEQTGFIAQEVEQVKPDWIGQDEKGYKTLTVKGFEAMAVEAIRELNNKVDKLAAENQELRKKLALVVPGESKNSELAKQSR